MIPITEESGVHKAWPAEARAITLDTLPAFLKKLTTEYQHDYGTICHALAAAMQAAFYAVESSPQGGITGFQASCVMWEVLKNTFHKEGPMRLVEYSDLLFPQYRDRFTSISFETMTWAREQAEKKLAEAPEHMHPVVAEHLRWVAVGNPPFGLRVAEA